MSTVSANFVSVHRCYHTPRSLSCALPKDLRLMFPKGFQPLALTASKGAGHPNALEDFIFLETGDITRILGTSRTASIEMCQVCRADHHYSIAGNAKAHEQTQSALADPYVRL